VGEVNFLKAKCQEIWYVVILRKSFVCVLPVQEDENWIIWCILILLRLKYRTLWEYCHCGKLSDVASYYSVRKPFLCRKNYVTCHFYAVFHFHEILCVIVFILRLTVLQSACKSFKEMPSFLIHFVDVSNAR
jgi:hypothetical protein